ncbi:hypothetical protein [Reyranella sp.]|uniref:hypothetical protein n=1 Tax=Reyranella sp. TaxID=1929291 RepID=UPI003BA8A5D5
MSAPSVLSNFLRPRTAEERAAAELFDADQPIRLTPVVPKDKLPGGAGDALQVEVLGYREQLSTLDGRRFRVLDPIWKLVPRRR